MLISALRNKPLLSLIVASIVIFIAQMTMQSMAGYLYPNYYNNTTAQSVSTILMLGIMFLSAAITKPIAKRIGKAEISAFSCGFAAFISILIFFIRPQNVWVYVALQSIGWLGLGIFTMVSWALVTDVIDYAELQNGAREDGSIYALYSFSRKLGQAGAAGLSGALLTLIGYSDTTQTAPDVLAGIFNISTLLPAIGFIAIALILWFWYPLHKEQVAKNAIILQRKHEQDADK